MYAVLAVAVIYLADKYGLLQLAYAYPLYSAAIAAVPAVVAVLSWRRRRTWFRIHIPADDPGHMNLPHFPDGVALGPNFRRYRVPIHEIPGTYPPGKPDGFGRRWANQWAYPPPSPDGTPIIRFIELKFANVAVQALGGDAIGCRADAKITVRSRSGGSFVPGTAVSVRRLNWYRDGWDEPLAKEVVDEKGQSSQPLLDRLYAAPSIGFNEYLTNPETTINEEEWQVLPLFYMRAGHPEVHLCGQQQGQFAGLSRGGEIVEFELEVTIRAQRARPNTVTLRCKAKWDVLSLEEAE